MSVIKTLTNYFDIVQEFNSAPKYRKELLIRGELLSLCCTLEPVKVRLKLRKFWQEQAAKLGVDVQALKTWN